MRSRTGSTLYRCALSIVAAAALAACSDAGTRPAATEPTDPIASYDATNIPANLRPSFEDRAAEVLLSHVPGPGQVELVVNGSFEVNGGPASKIFLGWETFDQAGGDQ